MRDRRGDQPGIDLDDRTLVDIGDHSMCPQSGPHVLSRRLDDFGGLDPPRLRRDGPGLDPGHVDDVLEEPLQPSGLAADDLHLVVTVGFRHSLGAQVVGCHREGGQRRPQVVAERREQRGAKFGALSDDLRIPALVQKLLPFNRNGGDAGDRVTRPGLERFAFEREETNRDRPRRRGTSQIRSPATSAPSRALSSVRASI